MCQRCVDKVYAVDVDVILEVRCAQGMLMVSTQERQCLDAMLESLPIKPKAAPKDSPQKATLRKGKGDWWKQAAASRPWLRNVLHDEECEDVPSRRLRKKCPGGSSPDLFDLDEDEIEWLFAQLAEARAELDSDCAGRGRGGFTQRFSAGSCVRSTMTKASTPTPVPRGLESTMRTLL